MSIKSWLLPTTTSSVTDEMRQWLAADEGQHAEQTARERLAEWQERAAVEQRKARQLGREYGRASRMIYHLRAGNALLREEVRQRDRDVADNRSVNDELAQALDERRPAPNAHWLGGELRRKWFGISDRLTDDERWEQVAETAIDAVRGLWPLDHPTTAQAGCADPAVAGEPAAGAGELPASGDTTDPAEAVRAAIASLMHRAERGLLWPPYPAPQTSPGGEDTSSPQPGPSPSGDPYDRAKVDDPRVEPMNLDRPMCSERSGSYRCTRRRLHSGQHVAEGITRVTQVWPNWSVLGDVAAVREQLAAEGLLGTAPAPECVCDEHSQSCDCDCHLGGTP